MGSKGFNLRESSLPLYCRPQQQQGVSFPATPGPYILLSILAILITYLNVWSPNTAEHETNKHSTKHLLIFFKIVGNNLFTPPTISFGKYNPSICIKYHNADIIKIHKTIDPITINLHSYTLTHLQTYKLTHLLTLFEI